MRTTVMKLSEEISCWIKKKVDSSGKKGIVVGLSGGIDSAVAAALAKKSLGDNVLGLILPCQSLSIDEKLAVKFARAFRIKVKKIDLSGLFSEIRGIFPEAGNAAAANLKPRLRMILLYYFANALDYLVVGTGNKSELMIGYFTKHGDGGCDLLPLGGLLKKDVRDLAKELKIPSDIIKRPPTAGLWKGQTDEKEIKMSYEELDAALEAIENGKTDKIQKENLTRVLFFIKQSGHKRKKIPVFNKKLTPI
jgi:NAD+ synthase